MNFRIGHGYDAHKLVENRDLILGGVKIEYEKGLLGHSDADVLVHAICDALLGAVAKRDIGYHFPDTDGKYKNISSLLLLEQVKNTISECGYNVSNIDSTIIAQRPKISHYINQMRENIAKSLDIPLDKINIKATTEEGMGFSGRGEGICAHSVCILFSE